MSRHWIRLVAVDDDPEALAILRAVMPEGITVEGYLTGQECLKAIKVEPPDIAVLDLRLPDMDGIELLRRIRGIHPEIEVILLTADYSTDAAVAAIKAGASDYLTKPVHVNRLREALGRSIEAIRGHQERQIAEIDLATKYSFAGMVGRSLAIRNIFDLVRRIGPHFRVALVTGPSGTGKELVARALHAFSNRSNSPLVVCNCAAIPESLLEAELSNALKFTGDGGRVVVRLKSEGAAAFRLEVSDTGIGVSEKDLPRLFVEFQQLDATTAKRYQGTGLGLALTKRIVEAQGGRVGVASRSGRGSTFFAVLPRVPRSASAPDGSARILVVDDQNLDLLLLSHILQSNGYLVETAETGDEAYEKCRREQFDAITLDLVLEDQPGWEVLARIRSLEKYRHYSGNRDLWL